MEEDWTNSKPSTSGANKRVRRASLVEEMSVSEDDANSQEDSSDDDAMSGSGSSTSSSTLESCPICLNRLRKQTVGNPECCEHSFCFDCISEWSKCTTTCPIDRQPFTSIIVKDGANGPVLRRESVETKAKLGEGEEDDLTDCEVCRRSDREDRMLLCDGCDRGFHLECLTPPLDSVPLDAWFCPRCDQRNNNGTLVRNRRLAIPRTRASEMVRTRIANRRLAQHADDLFESSEEEEEELEEDDEEESGESNYDSDDGVVYSLSPNVQRRPTPFVRRTRRRRTTKRRKRRKPKTRKTTTTTQKTPKSSTKTATPKRKTRRRGRKRRRRRRVRVSRPRKYPLRRTNSDTNLLGTNKATNAKIKKRLADRLGIVKAPKKGQHFPELKSFATSDAQPSSNATNQFSIFENKDALIAFSDENEPTGSTSSTLPTFSDKAKRFRTPLRMWKGEAAAAVSTQSKDTGTSGTSGLDVLGGIMNEQTMLMTPSSSVTIKRDGTLEKKPASSANSESEVASRKGESSQNDSSAVDQEQWKSDEKKSIVETKEKEMDGKRSSEKNEQGGNSKRRKMSGHDEDKETQQRSKPDGSRIAKTEIATDAVKSSPKRDGSFLQCIHPPPISFSSSTTRKKAPLLPSPNLPPSKTSFSDRGKSKAPLHTSESPSIDVTALMCQAKSRAPPNGAPARYASSTSPMNKAVDDAIAAQKSNTALMAAQVQQNLLMHQHRQILGPGGGMDNADEMHHLLQQHNELALRLAGQQQTQLLATAGNTEQTSLDTIVSASAAVNQVQAFLAPPNLAAAAAVQNALAVAAARQHQMNFLSTLRAASVANAQQQMHHGLMPALVASGGLPPSALLTGAALPHQLWLGAQAPPPPPPPPPPDLQLIPLPPPQYAPHDVTRPPPPVPPPVFSRADTDFGHSRVSLDARLSEIERDNNVPPELVSLLQQFAQIKKEQRPSQSQGSTNRASTAPKRGQPFSAVPVSPASSTSSPLVLDMAITTPTPEPAEPTPTLANDGSRNNNKKGRNKNSVKFGADVVEADEKKVKLSKTDVKHKKREDKLKKMLREAAKAGRAGASAIGGEVEVDTDDGVPSSAMDLKRREKVLAKFNYHLQVEEAVKNALRPYYSKRKITKEEYKDIMRKCVPKVCKKKGEIKPEKIKAFVDTCVAKVLTGKNRRGSGTGDD